MSRAESTNQSLNTIYGVTLACKIRVLDTGILGSPSLVR